MKKNLLVLLVTLVIIGLSAMLFLKHGSTGIPIDELETDARSSQKIANNWLIVKDDSDHISAMLFYNEDKTEYVYSIYLNEASSDDYQFSEGGSLGEVQRNVVEIDYGKLGSVLLSMNEQHITRIELQEDNDIKVITVEGEEPFVQVVPDQIDKVTLLDDKGEEVIIDTMKKE